MSVGIEHHIACLKIAVEETLGRLGREVFGKHAEIGFQFQLMEVKLGGFEKTILKIIEIEKHTLYIKFWLRIAL